MPTPSSSSRASDAASPLRKGKQDEEHDEAAEEEEEEPFQSSPGAAACLCGLTAVGTGALAYTCWILGDVERAMFAGLPQGLCRQAPLDEGMHKEWECVEPQRSGHGPVRLTYPRTQFLNDTFLATGTSPATGPSDDFGTYCTCHEKADDRFCATCCTLQEKPFSSSDKQGTEVAVEKCENAAKMRAAKVRVHGYSRQCFHKAETAECFSVEGVLEREEYYRNGVYFFGLCTAVAAAVLLWMLLAWVRQPTVDQFKFD